MALFQGLNAKYGLELKQRMPQQRISWRRLKNAIGIAAVVCGIGYFAYSNFAQTIEALKKGSATLTWVMNGLDRSREREEILLRKLELLKSAQACPSVPHVYLDKHGPSAIGAAMADRQPIRNSASEQPSLKSGDTMSPEMRKSIFERLDRH